MRARMLVRVALLLFVCCFLGTTAGQVRSPIASAESSDGANVVADLTTPTTLVTDNGDGSFTAQISAGAVRVADASQSDGWADLNLDLADTGPTVTPDTAIADIAFSDGGSGALASLNLGAKQFAEDWPTSLPTPTLDGDTATYADIQPGVDLVLRATPTGFEQSYVVRRAPSGSLVLDTPLSMKGLHAVVTDDGAIKVLDSAGNEKISADPAQMWDSTIDPVSGDSANQASVDTSLVSTQNGPMLELRPDAAFLASVAYPVTIDPTPNLALITDTYSDSGSPTGSHGGLSVLKVGTNDSGTTKFRSYLSFDTSSIAGKHILSATLGLYQTFANNCTPSTVQVFSLTAAFSQNTTWNSQPGLDKKYAQGDFGNGATGCNPDVAGGGWDQLSTGGAGGRTVTQLVADWASGAQQNYGFGVVAPNETANNQFKKFNSYDSGASVPYLTVTYNSVPNVPTNLTPASGTLVSTGNPTLGATFADSDGGTGQVVYSILDASGQPVLPLDDTLGCSCAAGDSVTSGSTSAFIVPLGTLSDGQTYTWTASGFDGTDLSSPTAPRTLQVDTTPAVPWDATAEGGPAVYSQTPSLGAVYRDPNGGSGVIQFRIMNQTCATVIVTGTSATVAADQVAQWSPPTPLAVGTYGVTARAGDSGNSWSDYSACTALKVIGGTGGGKLVSVLSEDGSHGLAAWRADADGRIFLNPADQGESDGYAMAVVSTDTNSIVDAQLGDASIPYEITQTNTFTNSQALSDGIYTRFGLTLDDLSTAFASAPAAASPDWATQYFGAVPLSTGTYADFGTNSGAMASATGAPIVDLGQSIDGASLIDADQANDGALVPTADPNGVSFDLTDQGISYALTYTGPPTDSPPLELSVLEVVSPTQPAFAEIQAAQTAAPLGAPTFTGTSTLSPWNAHIVLTEVAGDQLTAVLPSSQTTPAVALTISANWLPTAVEWQAIANAIQVSHQ